MIRHIIRIAAITIVALGCMFYPFAPGTHDRLAVTLSMMAQLLGLAGLLLVPIGALWLIYELMKRRHPTEPDSVAHKDKGSYFAIVALATSFVVAAVVALGGLTSTGPSLALIVLIVWGCLAWRWWSAIKRLKSNTSFSPGRFTRRFNPTALYLIFVPGILVIAQLAFMKRAVEFSRNRAMMGASEFIRAIEAYHASYGHYPPSLASVHHDYDPPIVGVERYHYEPSGRAYNVFFEQFTYRLPPGTQEFVMYNPLDEQRMIVHNQDLLEATDEEVNRERSFHARAAHDAGAAHWKYFWFD